MATTEDSKMEALLEANEAAVIVPQEKDTVTGTVVFASRREVRLDIAGLTTGVVRGSELFAESDTYTDLKIGDTIDATVIDLENENGEMELSFKYAGEAKAWETARTMFTTGEALSVKILDANKGGLIVKVDHLQGFLPVSQLAPEHYPRVSGGSKTRILEKLKEYVGMKFKVKVLDVLEGDNKLIVSEKAIWEEEQENVIAQFNVGDTVEGKVTAIADFGVFVKFPLEADDEAAYLEGLVHISEIAWQRIDHPRDFVKVNDIVKAQIIGIEGSKIFLSMKKLVTNPWEGVETKYKVGEVVEGTILKVNPFGFFVELDRDIHGLAHISELDSRPVTDINSLGKAGQKMKFMVVSVEPEKHRLGLSLKAMKKGAEKVEVENVEASLSTPAPEDASDASADAQKGVPTADAPEAPLE
ncbi:S1 RNA-binding domain-containing protein [Candidatus Uhrbacteria bacterium]|nr:S1 RNA-binding domain-containing protein [Candidatus Uhrbacteria bacterium]